MLNSSPANLRAPSRRKPSTFSIYAAPLLLLVIVLSGCGGGSNNATTQTPVRSGKVQMHVQWPAYQPGRSAGGRYIPGYAQSLFLELFLTDTPTTRYRMSANRPDDKPSLQTIAFNQFIPVGNYTLAVVARVEKEGQGATVASAATTFVVKEGQTFDANLTLATTLKTISIQGQPLSVSSGSVLSLVGQALDPDGKIVLLPVGALTWKLVSTNSIATITSDGAFTALSPGTARVRLSEDLAGVSAEADVIITNTVANPGGLANSSWPKAGGDIANTGRSKASGAIGTLGWSNLNSNRTFQFNGAVSIGEDGTLFAGTASIRVGNSPQLIALDSTTGTEKWHVALSEIGGQPTVGSDGTVYVGMRSGLVSAYESKTGAFKWSFQTIGGPPFDPITNPVSAFVPEMSVGSDGTVYVNAGVGYALDGKTGSQKWKADAGNGSQSIFSSSPAIGLLNTIYFGGGDPLFAVDGLTGAILWKVTAPNSIAGSFTTPSVGADGTVYCLHTGTPSVLYAFDGRTGTKKWQFIVSASSDVEKGSPAIGKDGTVYAVARNQLFAVDPTSGLMKWTSSGGSFQGQAPVIGADGTIYLYASSLTAFDPSNGNIKFSVSARTQDASTAQGLSIGADGSLYGVTTYSIYQIK